MLGAYRRTEGLHSATDYQLNQGLSVTETSHGISEKGAQFKNRKVDEGGKPPTGICPTMSATLGGVGGS